ncbi:MAG: DUF4258 domain-containing protein [Proteobacteria bacterium]|nr:DUF4258 domain-containing protein [Pseudomonadota bacterium]MBU1545310.1 DUF4258 domain-containing protein [Pseudomonadota bacterium]MBU2619639.1 DUF4258 domain-containing protein [Pseudomonadota bacterium]
MECSELIFTGHAIQRIFERRISVADVKTVIETGQIIDTYPDDRPHPSFLLLGFRKNTPIHVVVAKDQSDGKCFIITLYIPDDMVWQPDYQTRR